MRRVFVVSGFFVGAVACLAASPVHAVFQDIHDLQQLLKESETPSRLESFAKEIQTESLIASFRDVDQASWYAPYVATMVRRGVVSGDTDEQGNPRGTFRPQDYVTIAEGLKIVFRAAGIREEQCTGMPLNLQAAVHWARGFVLCAEGLAVRIVTPQTSLSRAMTRAEAVLLIDDVFGDTVPRDLPSPFRDTSGHRYAADIHYNALLRIISGDTDASGQPTGTFRPDEPLRRSEMVKVIARKLEKAGM